MVGLLVPIAGFVIVWELSNVLKAEVFGLWEGFSVRFVAIVGLCFNLIPLFYFMKHEKDDQLRGLVAATFLYAFAIVIFLFGQEALR